jgi:ATP-dependent DNA ligase
MLVRVLLSLRRTPGEDPPRFRHLVAFDMLESDGNDIRRLSLAIRETNLAKLLQRLKRHLPV